MTLGLWMTSFLLPLPNPGMSPLAAAAAVAFLSPPLRFSSFAFGKESVWTGMPRLSSRCALCNYAQQRSFGGGKLNFLGGNLRSVLCRDADLRSPPTYLPTYTYAPTKNLLDLKILLCVASSPPPGQR